MNPVERDSGIFSDNETHVLTTGRLDLKFTQTGGNRLFELAERQNPKRAFLFVSTVLGRHIPVCPKKHRSALWMLSNLVMPHVSAGPALIMGYAETAVGLGAGIFDCLRQKAADRNFTYLPTTRHPVRSSDEKPGATTWFCISEEHSHAMEHSVLYPGPVESGMNNTLVLVDDETTTGTTFARLAAGLWNQGLVFGNIVLATLTDWSGGQAAKQVSDVTGGTSVKSVSLLSGNWTWNSRSEAVFPVLPGSEPPECAEWKPTGISRFQSPRQGLRGQEMSSISVSDLPIPRKTDRILVIGTGEHVWQPFLYAESLAEQGFETGFIATTRSPVMPGPVLRHKITFSDHFGLGVRMYLHNVNPDEWDRIILFTETGIDGIDSELRMALGKGHVVDCNGIVHPMIKGLRQ